MTGGNDAGQSGAAHGPKSGGLDEPTIADGPRPETLPRGASIPGAPEQGSTIGRFMVLGPIGEGGMGAVYRAYDPKLQREVAVKVLKGAAGESERARVLREAQALAQLSHPNVVAVYDTGEHDGGVFIAMEYIVGEDLQSWLKTKRSWREVVTIMLQAGQGLAAAHASGLVHRDFKPANVLVGTDGRVRVLDFGLAKGTGQEEEEHNVSLSSEMALVMGSASQDGMSRRSALSEALTEDGLVMGTPSYMPPEQHFGRTADARADQFAFCVVLWEGLTGKRPFAGQGVRELAKAKLKPLKIPSTSTPRWLMDIAVRGLAPKPEKRWPSMDALLVQLGRDPNRARRRWIAVGGLAFVGAAGFGASELQERRQSQACAEEGASIEQVWSDAKAEELRVAFEATELPHASNTFEKVRPWIDRYATRWSELREQTCLDASTQPAGSQVPKLGRECFDERHDALASLLTVLMSPDATSLPLAVDSAAALPELDRCRDEIWLKRRPRAPQDEATRDRVRAVRQELGVAGSLNRAGKYEPALHQAREALVAAEEIGHAPLTIQARLLAAQLENQGGDYRLAANQAKQAFHAAVRIGDDEHALEAASQLIFHVGLSLARHDEGLAWSELAESLLARLDEQDSLVDARLQDNLGALRLARNENDQALAHYERALTLRQAALPPDHPGLGHALSNLGRLHRTRGEYDEAIRAHQEARRICETALGKDHPCVGVSLSDIGHVAEGRGDYPTALQNYEAALRIFEDTFGPDHPRLSVALRPLGLLNMVLGRTEIAEAYYTRALTVNQAALGPDHPNVGTSLNSLGAFHKAQRDNEKARDYFRRSLAIRERTLGPNHTEVARVLTNLGSVENWMGGHQEALVHQQRALSIFEARDGLSHPDVAWCLTELADTRRMRGEHVVAVAGYERALTIWAEFGGPDLELAHTKSGLALSLLESGAQPERAMKLALETREVWANSGPTFAWVAGLMDEAIAKAASARAVK